MNLYGRQKRKGSTMISTVSIWRMRKPRLVLGMEPDKVGLHSQVSFVEDKVPFVLVLLGEGYYVERTSKQAIDILRRRGKTLDAQVDALIGMMKDLQLEAAFFNSTADDAEEGLVEIREEFIEEDPMENTYRNRKVIHIVGPKYAVKYRTAAENSLSHCYRACLELLIENGLLSIAVGCIYTETKNYPREPAAHVSIRTMRRFLEKPKDKIMAVVFCTVTSDTEIYKRNSSYLDSYLDLAFMSLIKDPYQRRKEQWDKTVQSSKQMELCKNAWIW